MRERIGTTTGMGQVRLKFVGLIFALSGIIACGPTLRPPTVSPELLRQEQEAQRELTFKINVERQMRLGGGREIGRAADQPRMMRGDGVEHLA